MGSGASVPKDKGAKAGAAPAPAAAAAAAKGGSAAAGSAAPAPGAKGAKAGPASAGAAAGAAASEMPFQPKSLMDPTVIAAAHQYHVSTDYAEIAKRRFEMLDKRQAKKLRFKDVERTPAFKEMPELEQVFRRGFKQESPEEAETIDLQDFYSLLTLVSDETPLEAKLEWIFKVLSGKKDTLDFVELRRMCQVLDIDLPADSALVEQFQGTRKTMRMDKFVRFVAAHLQSLPEEDRNAIFQLPLDAHS